MASRHPLVPLVLVVLVVVVVFCTITVETILYLPLPPCPVPIEPPRQTNPSVVFQEYEEFPKYLMAGFSFGGTTVLLQTFDIGKVKSCVY